ncbi:putative ribonuclease H protein At1g65750 family [Senna tora]|uniref:Putative ribonuclease H protein At1g65750 family n=1 Tax=Senna tora TaxID=362788 RepID=A0A835C901_9FABA|nr:putative ribonuclease H protein At1g65750 family [Senna tora]
MKLVALIRLWKLKLDPQLIELNNDFFLVFFDLPKDRRAQLPHGINEIIAFHFLRARYDRMCIFVDTAKPQPLDVLIDKFRQKSSSPEPENSLLSPISTQHREILPSYHSPNLILDLENMRESLKKVGFGNIVMAELWENFSGISMAKEFNFFPLVESDSQCVVKLIMNNDTAKTHPSFPLINSCSLLLGMTHPISLSHIYQEANTCIDLLAKKVLNCRVE